MANERDRASSSAPTIPIPPGARPRSLSGLAVQESSLSLLSLLLVPRIIVPPEQLRVLSLGHSEVFMLSRITGTSSVDEIARDARMAVRDVLAKLTVLIDMGIVVLQ
jgi:hypothetical protein